MNEPILPRSSPGLRVAAWVAGLGLLIVAIELQRQLWQTPTPGVDLTPFWLLLAVALAFALIAAYESRPDSTSDPDARLAGTTRQARGPDHSANQTRGDRWDDWLRLVVCAICEAAALWLFWRNDRVTLAWVLHLVASVLLLLGVWGREGRPWRALLGSWSRLDAALLLALVLLALLVRVWQVGSVPQGLWFDEAQRGNEALRILAEPRYRPVFTPGATQEATGFWYLIVPFVAALGRDPLALRLPAAVGGALGVGAVYLLARQLFDRRTALVAAGLTVGMTWHVNFSRVGFPTIWSVTLDTLAAAFFVLGLRRGSASAFAAAGVTAGAALYFYYTSLLLPLTLAALAFHQLMSRRREFVGSCGVGLVACALGFLVAAAPFGQYAVLHPREFNQRTSTVSIFKELEQAGSWEPLVRNVRVHLLMFNVRGDANGRHNWSGRPMLDEVTGALVVVGFAVALVRCWRLPYTAPLVWFVVSLTGGVLSLTWEAPQGNRTMDVVTALALFAALPVAFLWRASDRLARVLSGLSLARGPRRQASTHVVGLTVVALVALTGALNVQRYFTQQQRDFRTWMEFSTPVTEAARQINDVPLDWKIYLDPLFVGQPTLSFLVRQPRQFAAFEPAAHLPLSDDAAAIYLTAREAPNATRIAEFYPDAPRQTLRPPAGGDVQLYSFLPGRDDVRASRGVLARYGPAGQETVGREARLDFRWPAAAPLPPPFSAAFQASLKVPAFGTYRLKLEGPADASLVLDGLPILAGGQETALALALGVHALRLEAPSAGQEPLRLLWAPPGSQLGPVPERSLHVPPVLTQGLLARLYRGREPGGQPALERVDAAIALHVHLLPLERPYTVEWSGAVWADRGGTYRFGTDSRDASAVWIDRQQVIANTSNGYAEGSIGLDAGWHDIRVRFLDATSFTRIELYWQPPGEARAILPSQALRPWPPARVAVAEPENVSPGVGSTPLLPPTRPEPPAASERRPTEPHMMSPDDATLQPATAPAPAGIPLAPAGALMKPRGAAIGLDGTVYVADSGRRAVVVLPSGGLPRTLAEGQLDDPSAVAALPDGSLVVAEAGANSLRRIAPDGRVGERFVPSQTMYRPRGLSATPDGRLLIADTGRSQVEILAPDGSTQVLRGLDQPTDAALLPDGTLLVAETGARRLILVTPDGQRLASWSVLPSGTEAGPHVAALPGGGWVATLSEQGTLARMAPNGSAPELWPAEPRWRHPSGVAAGPRGIVVVDAEAATADLLSLP